ncbi:AP-5 complex subunit mu-1 isoform X2 [Protobothrops mucrosquamatus]|uniref:AP-5 complex subunit mu-1 isoform X1 n=1 Tax=Protobothrops mucrosquamatus TaxID=103944 RepID=UPI0007756F61|nr:AP-5 complex subunit mu-1 isoform X1 [Protobothrops mucrosquamatus]XP_015687619.1 AP-5 complex subunit mu-1 isoform X2 [Protobothrops mucrosquamatus]
MALRGLWLISHEQEVQSIVLFSRRYPTVEKRAQFFNGPSYVPIPEDGPFLKALLFELRLTDEGQHFVECRDGCSRINKTSVYTLQVERKDLWPVVAFRKNGLIYVGLPLVEQSLIPQPPLFSISGISQAFDFLLGLLAFMNSNQKSEADRSTKVAQLPSLVMQACPLGTPLDTNLNGSLENSHVAVSSHTQKPPAWRSNTYKGKPQVNICIVEKVKSVQYDQRDVADMWQVYGTITCKCDIEGTAPNVTVGLNLPANGSPLQDILVHPCVTSLDSAILTSSSVDAMDDSAFSGPYKFPLIPPSDLFNLCFYTSQVPVPPILGFYQLKEEESQWKFTIHLKLHESMKNTFEYCKAYIPFFNRGPITHLEYKISYGQLEVSKEKSLFIWFIGQKFPKSLEISLTGTVAFGPTNQDQPVDAVCTGNTAYVKLYFKILDFTLTGCYTDQHSIQVFSSGKAKISTAREVLSSDYYIWNSKAPAPVVYRTLLF